MTNKLFKIMARSKPKPRPFKSIFQDKETRELLIETAFVVSNALSAIMLQKKVDACNNSAPTDYVMD